MTSLVRPRFSEFLQEGESVRFSISIGRHEDGYPIYTTAFATYKDNRFTVEKCQDVPSLVGKSRERPGTILHEFIRGLKESGLLGVDEYTRVVGIWRHCYVIRNGKHISFGRLTKCE